MRNSETRTKSNVLARNRCQWQTSKKPEIHSGVIEKSIPKAMANHVLFITKNNPWNPLKRIRWKKKTCKIWQWTDFELTLDHECSDNCNKLNPIRLLYALMVYGSIIIMILCPSENIITYKCSHKNTYINIITTEKCLTICFALYLIGCDWLLFIIYNPWTNRMNSMSSLMRILFTFKWTRIPEHPLSGCFILMFIIIIDTHYTPINIAQFRVLHFHPFVTETKITTTIAAP